MILLPDNVQMSSSAVDIEGIVVDIGPDAWKDMSEPRAKLGEKVQFTRYTGGLVKGRDGYLYRFIPSHAIYAVQDE